MKNGHIFTTPSAHRQVNVWKYEDYIIYRELESSFINTKGTLWCNTLSRTFVGVTKYLYVSSESQIVSNIFLFCTLDYVVFILQNIIKM